MRSLAMLCVACLLVACMSVPDGPPAPTRPPAIFYIDANTGDDAWPVGLFGIVLG